MPFRERRIDVSIGRNATEGVPYSAPRTNRQTGWPAGRLLAGADGDFAARLLHGGERLGCFPSFNQTATQFGLGAGAHGNPSFDDFQVTQP